MDVATMHYEFKVGLDKVDSLSNPNLIPEEIDVFLNNAVERFISQRGYGNNVHRTGLEETQKRMDDLRNITLEASLTLDASTTANKPNGHFVSLPADYRHAIDEELEVTYLDCTDTSTTKRLDVKPLTHGRYNSVIKDPFNKPDGESALRLVYEGDKFEIILSSEFNYATASYKLRYFREPATITYGTQYQTVTTDVDCDLAPHTHKEIVKMAITEALGNIESQRVQLSNQELNQIE